MTVTILIVTAAALGAFFWQKDSADAPVIISTDTDGISVVATFYPLAEFARAAGGDMVTVKSIVPAGSEPHDYEPSPRDILAVYQADIFLSNGAGADAWAEKIRPDLEERDITVVRMSDVVETLSKIRDEQGVVDPHFWIDPVLAQQEVSAIRDVLIARDPMRAEAYVQNATLYIEELKILDTAYRDGLRQCELHTIVTSHDAFAYLAKRYGFETLSVSGISPEAEPSSRTLAEIAETVRTLGLRHIFFETLVSPKVAQTLADEVGAETLVFNPLEGLTDEERQAGKNYLSIMRDNLNNLQTALRCQQ